jgi:hypothetical protein
MSVKLNLDDRGLTLEEEEGFLKEMKNGNNRKKTEKHNSSNDSGKGKTAASNNNQLPDLNKIKEVKKTNENKAQERYEKRKEWAEKAGKLLYPMEKRIEELKKDSRVNLVPELQEELEDLERNREQMLEGVDESLLGHTYFSAFIEEIRWTRENPSGKESINKIINRLLQEERIEEVSDKPEKGYWIYWLGKYYQGVSDPEAKEISSGTTALMLETIKAINSEQGRYKKEVKEIIQEMRKNPPITRIEPKNGLYSGYVPSESKRHGSYITVKVVDEKIIRPVKATGFLEKLFQVMEREKSYITVHSFSQERLDISRQLPRQKFNDLVKFWWSLKKAEEIK